MAIAIVEIKDNVIEDMRLFKDEDTAKAEEFFKQQCSTYIWNWNEYTAEEIQGCIDDGYATYGNSSFCIWHVEDSHLTK